MAYFGTKRRVFISHYKEDRLEVDAFIHRFSTLEGVFTPYVLGASINDDLIDSTNTNYVMSRIRQLYLRDSTVTIVLVGGCTHSRRYVDWEIKSSLTRGSQTPNGLVGIILPSQGTRAHLPGRFADNWAHGNIGCYARYYTYPSTASELGSWIDDAFDARVYRADLIQNKQQVMRYNRKCEVCLITH